MGKGKEVMDVRSATEDEVMGSDVTDRSSIVESRDCSKVAKKIDTDYYVIILAI